MIAGRLKDVEDDCIRSDLNRILCFLMEYADTLEGHVSLDGERLFADRISVLTKPAEQCVFEAHRRYADLHYILSGTEGISTAPAAGLQPLGAFDVQRDIGFYTGESAGTVYLKPGDFMLCPPTDAHRVAEMLESPARVEKIVVKIAVYNLSGGITDGTDGTQDRRVLRGQQHARI